MGRILESFRFRYFCLIFALLRGWAFCSLSLLPLLIFFRKSITINPPTLRSVVGGEGESLREGEGSDFAIQVPYPPS